MRIRSALLVLGLLAGCVLGQEERSLPRADGGGSSGKSHQEVAKPRLPLAVQTPPVGTTHKEMLAYLTALCSRCPEMELEIAGQSVAGREIPAVFIPPRSRWRTEAATVMIFAQQHGDEPSGKEALLMLLDDFCAEPAGWPFLHLNLMIVPSVNPDGGEAHRRRNDRQVDLNRNHAILTEPETRLLRTLFNRYAAQVTLDVHEYGIRSWLRQGLSKDLGEQFDCISNPAIPEVLLEFARERLLWPAIERARERGVNANRYLVTQDDPALPVRHSTTDIDDGRNGFGIDCTLSFILEGPNGLWPGDRIWQRAKGQLAFIESFLAVCEANHEEIVRVVSEARKARAAQPPREVAIQADYTLSSSGTLQVTILSTRDLRDTTIVLPDYRSAPEVLYAVEPPEAYVVERPTGPLLELLAAHGFAHELLTAKKSMMVEEFRVEGWDTLRCEGRKTVVPAGGYWRAKKTFNPGALLVPVNGVGAAKLVQIMEPRSLYGLSHYDQFSDLFQDKVLPIYRLLGFRR
ncbi:MAG: M14 family zinc carboxypeptidase [bacterium]|jgi:hypothetical protein|nr:M14 family zinc carboxypeptidase [candidate division KSB1 bacterium]MDH7558813.1 M14 family zinc carboxypeptidase [bacterium]